MWHVYVYVCVCVCAFLPYHFTYSTVFGHLEDFAMDMLDSEMVVNNEEKWWKIRRLKGRNLDPHVTCVVNCCQGNVAGVMF